jgi:hypothetical protein
MYICPVCKFDKLPDPPENFEICPSCGTEFGYHDTTKTFHQLRDIWIASGAKWHSKVIPMPVGWDGLTQLGFNLMFNFTAAGFKPNVASVKVSDAWMRTA